MGDYGRDYDGGDGGKPCAFCSDGWAYQGFPTFNSGQVTEAPICAECLHRLSDMSQVQVMEEELKSLRKIADEAKQLLGAMHVGLYVRCPDMSSAYVTTLEDRLTEYFSQKPDVYRMCAGFMCGREASIGLMCVDCHRKGCRVEVAA